MANDARIRWSNFDSLTGNALGVGVTTLTCAALAAQGAIPSTAHVALIVEPGTANEEEIRVTTSLAGDNPRPILRGQGGTAEVAHAAGVQIICAPTKRDYPLAPVSASYQGASDISVVSTTFADLPGVGTALDLVVICEAGDRVTVWPNLCWSVDAPVGNLDFALLNPSTDAFVRRIANTPQGLGGWAGMASSRLPIGAPFSFTVQPGDVINGTIKLRPQARVTSAGTRKIYTDASNWFVYMQAQNFGPQIAG